MAMPDLAVEVAFTTGADTGTLLQLDDPSRGKLDTGTLGATTTDVPIWTDVTDWVRSGSISRGSNRVDNPIVTYEAGNCSITLRNDDRRFDPSYLDGPYTEVTALLDGTSVQLNSNGGFESGTSGWGSGSGGTLAQASDQVHSGSFSGKFTPTGSAFQPFVDSAWASFTAGETYRATAWVRCAVASTIFAAIHWWDATPTFLSQTSATWIVPAATWTQVTVTGTAPAGATQGPMLFAVSGTPAATDFLWVDDAVLAHLPYQRATQVTAMRAVRVLATWAGTTYELFRGYADQWDVQWFEPNYSECVLTATDAFKILSGIDRTAVAAVGGGETTGARVGRILDSASWEAVDRTIATGDSTVQATDLSGDVLAELQTVAQTELGEIYMDGGGKVVFRNRNAALTDSRSSTSQATFGDGGGSEMPYQGLTIAADDATFFNEVRVTRSGGTEQVASDTESQALYYKKTYRPPADPILQTDADALQLANWLLHVAADPELRFTELEVNPRHNGLESTLFPHALGRLLGDRITIVRRPPGGGDPISKEQFIRGIDHQFTPDSWVVKWALQDASRFGSFLVLDHATLGQLDAGNALGF